MIKTLLRENGTLRELLLGIWIFGLLAEVVLVIFFPPVIYRTIGLVAGLVAGSAMAIHMAYCIELSVTLDEKGANSYVRKMTIIRYIAVCIVLVVLALLGIGDPVSYIIGTLGLKIGAYSQPIIHKFLNTFKKKVTNEDTKLEEYDINNNKGGE